MPDSFDGDFDGYEGHIAQAPFDDEEQGAPSAAEILAADPALAHPANRGLEALRRRYSGREEIDFSRIS